MGHRQTKGGEGRPLLWGGSGVGGVLRQAHLLQNAAGGFILLGGQKLGGLQLMEIPNYRGSSNESQDP